MTLKSEDVQKIAHLARLQIDPADVEQYTTELSNILALFDQMNSQDSSGVEPMAHPLDAVQRLRVDEVTEGDQREKFQAIAPEVARGLYLVPKVID